MKFDVENAVPTFGNAVDPATDIRTADSAARCCIATNAGVSGGTTCNPRGSTAFNGEAKVLRTGANNGLEVDEFDGNMRNAGGWAMVDRTCPNL